MATGKNDAALPPGGEPAGDQAVHTRGLTTSGDACERTGSLSLEQTHNQVLPSFLALGRIPSPGIMLITPRFGIEIALP